MMEAAGDPQTAAAAGTIRFGSFEVDTRSGELRRKGMRVKLSAQPFDVLVALVERPGQVVTREELRDGEWVTYVLLPEGTLWRSRVNGSERTQLTIAPFRVTLPRWSPGMGNRSPSWGCNQADGGRFI
jgi:hypothetical protein